MIIVGMLLHIQVYMDSKCTNVHVHGIQIHKDSLPYLSFESEYCAKEKLMIHQYIALQI